MTKDYRLSIYCHGDKCFMYQFFFSNGKDCDWVALIASCQEKILTTYLFRLWDLMLINPYFYFPCITCFSNNLFKTVVKAHCNTPTFKFKTYIYSNINICTIFSSNSWYFSTWVSLSLIPLQSAKNLPAIILLIICNTKRLNTVKKNLHFCSSFISKLTWSKIMNPILLL